MPKIKLPSIEYICMLIVLIVIGYTAPGAFEIIMTLLFGSIGIIMVYLGGIVLLYLFKLLVLKIRKVFSK